MPPKGRGGRGRGRAGGRGAKAAGRAGRAQSNKQPNQGKTNPPAKRAKQNSQSVAVATSATEPAGKTNVVAAAGAKPKGPGATPPARKANAVAAEAKPAAPVAHPASEAKVAVARQAPREASAQRTPAPATPASVPSGDRASRIDSALKQILSSPSPQHALPPTTMASAAAAAAEATSTDPTQSRPWSRDDYFARVKTFKPSYWFAPPRQVSPMVCARFGWVCSSTDALVCQSCESRITYRAPVSDSDEEWTATIDAFTRRLSDAHTPECPWRKEACPSGFLEFPPSDGDELFASFIARLRDLIQYQRETSWLPRVQSAARLAPDGELQELDVDSPSPRNLAALAGFPQTCADTAHAACMLALFGWTIRISNAQHGPSSTGSSSPVGPMAPGGDCNGVLQCDLCGRTCGVWNFSALKSTQPKKQEHQKHKVPEEIERPSKLRRTQPPAAATSGHAGSAPLASNAQTVEMLSSYKRGRHPCLGGVEPQLVGQYAARRHGPIQPDPAQSSLLWWRGHFVAEALLWATPLRVVAESRPNKRQRGQQSRHGSANDAPPSSDDSDINDGEMDSDDGFFDARVEHRSFCPWVGDGDRSRPLGLHPGWRQTRTVVLMEIKRRQRGDLPFRATGTAGVDSVAAFSAEEDEAAGSNGAGGKMALDTTSVWAALRRSLHGVR